jgi:hypothetical protein
LEVLAAMEEAARVAVQPIQMVQQEQVAVAVEEV